MIAPLSSGKISGNYNRMLICDICMMLYHCADTQKFQGSIRYHFKLQSLKPICLQSAHVNGFLGIFADSVYWKLQVKGMIHRYWKVRKTSDIKHNFPHLTAKRLINLSSSLTGKWQSQNPSLPQSHHRVTLTVRLTQSHSMSQKQLTCLSNEWNQGTTSMHGPPLTYISSL